MGVGVAQKRLAMKDIKEVFRLRFQLGFSQRKVAKATGFGRTTVQEYELRAKKAGITELRIFETLTAEEIYNKLGFSVTANSENNIQIKNKSTEKILPEWNLIREELSRKHMTLMLLWTEYKDQYAEKAYQYSQFCDLYRQWSKKLSVVMRQEHKAGEKIFVRLLYTSPSPRD